MNAAALALLALAATGCSGALWSEFDHRSGRTPHAGTAIAALRAGPGMPKSQVLATLGPPVEVLPLPDGDVFVYRLRVTDVTLLNLSPGLLTGIYVPVYARLEGRAGDDVVFVQFDERGHVRSVAAGAPR